MNQKRRSRCDPIDESRLYFETLLTTGMLISDGILFTIYKMEFSAYEKSDQINNIINILTESLIEPSFLQVYTLPGEHLSNIINILIESLIEPSFLQVCTQPGEHLSNIINILIESLIEPSYLQVCTQPGEHLSIGQVSTRKTSDCPAWNTTPTNNYSLLRLARWVMSNAGGYSVMQMGNAGG